MLVVFTIQEAKENDIEFLWDMLYEAVYVPGGEARPPREIVHEPEMAKYLEGWGREGDLALVAINNDRCVGAIWYRLFNEQNKTYGYIDEHTPILSMAVLPDFRGKGVGTLLLEEIHKRAKDEGFKRLSLSVDPNNPALRLYERFGFKKVGIDGTSWDMVAEV